MLWYDTVNDKALLCGKDLNLNIQQRILQYYVSNSLQFKLTIFNEIGNSSVVKIIQYNSVFVAGDF